MPKAQLVWGGGLRGAMTRLRIWARVFLIALRQSRGPLQAAAAIRDLNAMRSQSVRPSPKKFAYASGRYFWGLYSPGWPSPAFDRFVTAQVNRAVRGRSRSVAMQTAIVAITRRCALRCEHCFEWDVLNRGEVMSSDDLDDIVRRLQQRGVTQIFFSGGEPLQRFGDLLRLTGMLSPNMDVWVLTSGRGLTAERASQLRTAGLTGIAVSLDHWNAKDHDEFRGRDGTFAAVESAAAHTISAGLILALSLCPTRSFVSVANMDRYAETARALGASFIQIFEPRPTGHYEGLDVDLNPLQQRILEEFADRLNFAHAARDLPAVEYIDRNARTFGCAGAGDRYLYIDTSGLLQPCPFCRTEGVPILNRDIDEAIQQLRQVGCQCTHNHCAQPELAGRSEASLTSVRSSV